MESLRWTHLGLAEQNQKVKITSNLISNPFFAEKVIKLLLESSFEGPSQNQAEKIPLEKFNCN